MSVKKVTHCIIIHFSDRKHNEDCQGISANIEVSMTVKCPQKNSEEMLTRQFLH